MSRRPLPGITASHVMTQVMLTVNTIIQDPQAKDYAGEYAMLGLSSSGLVLDHRHVLIGTPHATSTDLSKLQTLHHALTALTQSLADDESVGYGLVINQAANNVHGWFSLNYARHSPTILAATNPIFILLRHFPRVVWHRQSRPTIEEAIRHVGGHPICLAAS